MAPVRSRCLADVEVARAVKAGDPAARLQVRERYADLARELAQKICRRIAHRGGHCRGRAGAPGDCDLAFTWVELDLLDRFAGRGATGSRRARKALIVTWLDNDQLPATFAAYARGRAGYGLPGMVSDGRRSWNRARGLRTRVHVSAAMLEDALQRYRDLIADNPEAEAARQLGVEAPRSFMRWVQALFDDACETGLLDPIDVARVARHLCGSRGLGPGIEDAAALLAPAVDLMLWHHWPEWWHEYLDRPRQHTRLFLPLTSVAEDQPSWAA